MNWEKIKWIEKLVLLIVFIVTPFGIAIILYLVDYEKHRDACNMLAVFGSIWMLALILNTIYENHLDEIADRVAKKLKDEKPKQ